MSTAYARTLTSAETILASLVCSAPTLTVDSNAEIALRELRAQVLDLKAVKTSMSVSPQMVAVTHSQCAQTRIQAMIAAFVLTDIKALAKMAVRMRTNA